MKKTRSLIIMVILLVCLIGGFALWQLLPNLGNKPTESTTTISPPREDLLSIEAENVELIRLTNESGSLELVPVWQTPVTPTPEATSTEPSGSTEPSVSEAAPEPRLTWEVNDTEMEVSPELVSQLVNRLISLRVSEDLGVKTDEELAEFGLDQGLATAEYELKDGETIAIVLGNKVEAATSDQYYALNRNTGRVAVLGTSADALLQNIYSLLDRVVITWDIEAIDSFVLQRQTEDYEIKAKRNPDLGDEPPAPGTSQWLMETPVAWNARDNYITNLLTEILGVQAEEFHPWTDETERDYGFAEPRYKITLSSEATDLTLLISDSVAGDRAYGQIEGKEYFFSFNRSVLTQTGMSALDLYDPFAGLVNIMDVREVLYTQEDENYRSRVFHPTPEEKADAKENGQPEPEVVYTLNGQDADVTNDSGDHLFTRYYQTLIGVTIDGFDPEQNPSLDEPAYEITYRMRNNEPNLELAFVERDANTLFLFKNGEYTGLYVRKANFASRGNVDEPGVSLALELLEAEISGEPETETTTEAEPSESTATTSG